MGLSKEGVKQACFGILVPRSLVPSLGSTALGAKVSEGLRFGFLGWPSTPLQNIRKSDPLKPKKSKYKMSQRPT